MDKTAFLPVELALFENFMKIPLFDAVFNSNKSSLQILEAWITSQVVHDSSIKALVRLASISALCAKLIAIRAININFILLSWVITSKAKVPEEVNQVVIQRLCHTNFN